MRTTVSTKGQIAIPVPLRPRPNICAGDSLDISVEQGRIVLTAPKRKHFKARIIEDPITGFPCFTQAPMRRS